MKSFVEHAERARRSFAEARELAAAANRALDTAETALSNAVQGASKGPFDGAQIGPVEATEHLREHRPGRPAKLDSDPELRAFVLARIDWQTFEQIADAVAESFPEKRRVSKTSIHKWWRSQPKGQRHPE